MDRVKYSDVKETAEELLALLVADVDALEAAKECDNVGELHDVFEEKLYLSEYVDGKVDIYNHDLREWAVSWWMWVEEAIAEGITGEGADYHQAIMAGQYVYYSEVAHQAIEELFNNSNEDEVA